MTMVPEKIAASLGFAWFVAMRVVMWALLGVVVCVVGGVATAVAAEGTCVLADPELDGRKLSMIVRTRPVDYGSTSVAIHDVDGDEVVADDVFNSGVRPPGLSVALSGDVVLPSNPVFGGFVVLIDRLYASLVFLRADVFAFHAQVSVLGDGKAQDPDRPTSTYVANPRDFMPVGVHEGVPRAYVTRYDDDGGNAPRGDDIAVVDLAAQRMTGAIALKQLIPERLRGRGGSARVRARPDRMVAGAGRVYVTLHMAADGFDAYDGVVAEIDPASDSVTRSWTLEGCLYPTSPVIDRRRGELVVACQGSLFTDEAPTRAGVYRLNLCDPDAGFARWQSGETLGGKWVSGVTVSGATAFVTLFGQRSDNRDELVALDTSSATGEVAASLRTLATYGPFEAQELRALPSTAGGADVVLSVADPKNPRLERYSGGDTASVRRVASWSSSPVTQLLPDATGLFEWK